MVDRPGTGTPGKNMAAYKGPNPPPARGNRGSRGRPGAQFGPGRAVASADAAEQTYAPPPPPRANSTPAPSSLSESAVPEPEPSPSPAPTQPSDSDHGWTRMEIEEYSGPDLSYVEGEDGSGLEDGDNRAIPDAEPSAMPVEQPTAETAQPQPPENEQLAAQPTAELMQIDPALTGSAPQLAYTARTDIAEQVDLNAGMAATAASENGGAGGDVAALANVSTSIPSADSAVSPAGETAPVPVTDGSTASTADAALENATAAPSPPIKPEPTIPVAPATTAPSPSPALVPTPPPPPPQQPAPPASRDPREIAQRAFDAAMHDAMGADHPHAAAFDNIRKSLGASVIVRSEGQYVIVRDPQGNEHRVPAEDVDRVQAEAIGIPPSQYEQELARREQERARQAFTEARGGRGMLGDDGEEEDGEAGGEEDSEGDISSSLDKISARMRHEEDVDERRVGSWLFRSW